MADSASHMAEKVFLGKRDCSQAYHCLQMADNESIQLLAFNFASQTFAYKRLAQYKDDKGIAGRRAPEFIENFEAVFQKIRAAGLKLSMGKSQFEVQEIEF